MSQADQPLWHAWLRCAEFRHLLLLTLLWAGLMLPMLPRVPRVFCDDSWSQAMAAYTIAYEGRPRNPGHVLGDADEFLLEPRLFGSLVGAMVYRVAGFSLTAGRLVAVAFAWGLLVAVYAVMRRLFDARAALAIAALTALDPWIFITGRTYRPDIILAAMLWAAGAFCLWGIDQRRLWKIIAGGVCLGLACWTHPNAVVFAAAAGIALVLGVRAAIPYRRYLGWFAIGVILGVLPYVLYVAYAQYISDVRLFEQLHWRMGAGVRSFAEMFATEKQRWTQFLQLPERLPLLLLFVFGMGCGLWRRDARGRFLAFFVLASCVLMPLVNHLPTGRYLVVLAPALVALLWRALPFRHGIAGAQEAVKGWFTRTIGWRGVAIGGTLVGYVAMTAGPTALVLWGHRHADYGRWMSGISEKIPGQAKVMAHSVFWTGLHDRPFRSSVIPNGSSTEYALCHIRAFEPEYLIQCSYAYAGLGGVGARSRDVCATPFGRACEQVATEVPSEVVAEFYDRDFGAARVWHLEWPVSPD